MQLKRSFLYTYRMLINYNEALSKWLEVIKNFYGKGEKKKNIPVENTDGEMRVKDVTKRKQIIKLSSINQRWIYRLKIRQMTTRKKNYSKRVWYIHNRHIKKKSSISYSMKNSPFSYKTLSLIFSRIWNCFGHIKILCYYSRLICTLYKL